MIDKLAALALKKRAIVWIVFALVSVYGYISFTGLPIEAYPDIADVTSQVVTQVPGLAAEEVEQQITVPLERALINTPGLEIMRSKSTFALSLITVVFKDGVESYWSRQRLQERIAQVSLPYGAQPGLDALTSPIGEIFRYTLESPQRSLRELSELQFWTVQPRLKQVQGVADVANFGGITTQFLLVLDPARLSKYKLSLAQVEAAIKANNSSAGGSVLTLGEQGFVIRGVGLLSGLDDLANVVVTTTGNGVPVKVGDLGSVALGNQERHGVLGKDGNPDGVSGIVLLLKGENASAVMANVHQAVDELNGGRLPADVKIVPYLDRTHLVDLTVHTVARTLAEGMALVVIVLFLFLGSPRAAGIVALTIPISLLIAFIFMNQLHVPANLLSLGAIDFGILVDGAIIMLENLLRLREEGGNKPMLLRDAYAAAVQVAQPIFFATLIIIVAYLPLFGFERVEYKLFSPMAYAVGFSLVGALVVTLLLIPGLAYVAYRRPQKLFTNHLIDKLSYRYRSYLLRFTVRTRLAIGVSIVTLLLTGVLGATVGKDFLPYLDEGSIWLQVTLPPGISLAKANEMAGELRQATLEFPEVEHIVTQLGRNDDGTDPFTPSHIECAVTLHPYDSWKSGLGKQELIAKMAARFDQLPGIDVGFSQPMIDGVYDKIAGAHSELVVKVYGENFDELRRIAGEVEQALDAIPGSADVAIDQEPPLPQVRITLDRAAAARYGLNADDISDLISSGISGGPQAQIFLGEKVYDVALRIRADARDDPAKIGNLLLTAPGGAQVALSQIAKIELRSGESTITREMARRHLTVKLNLRGRDLGSFLKEAQPKIEQVIHYDHLKYQIVWGGQFENQRRSQQRLMLVVPGALALMFVLLFGAFGNLRHPLLILATVPLAAVGGLAALELRGMTLNVSSAVGFIALFGVAIQNGIIMVANLNRWRELDQTLLQAVMKGARQRFRPVLIAATVATVGLVPAAFTHDVGSDVQRPLATVIIGGMITATALTLILLPALYFLIETWAQRRAQRKPPETDRSLDEWLAENK